jgi:hypothetical protein
MTVKTIIPAAEDFDGVSSHGKAEESAEPKKAGKQSRRKKDGPALPQSPQPTLFKIVFMRY